MTHWVKLENCLNNLVLEPYFTNKRTTLHLLPLTYRFPPGSRSKGSPKTNLQSPSSPWDSNRLNLHGMVAEHNCSVNSTSAKTLQEMWENYKVLQSATWFNDGSQKNKLLARPGQAKIGSHYKHSLEKWCVQWMIPRRTPVQRLAHEVGAKLTISSNPSPESLELIHWFVGFFPWNVVFPNATQKNVQKC